MEKVRTDAYLLAENKWWAWVDLNHRPRPYQGLLWCYMHSIIFMRGCGPCRTVRERSWRSGREWEYRMNRNPPRVAYLRVKPRQPGLPTSQSGRMARNNFRLARNPPSIGNNRISSLLNRAAVMNLPSGPERSSGIQRGF